jgi:hypothetical protein
MDIIKNYHDKKWTLQLLDVLYNSIDMQSSSKVLGYLSATLTYTRLEQITNS